MTETRELRSVLSAAEQAANAGNYAAAEPLLREAAHLLETSLGASHPELANTLNNLAVVCELTGQIDEAEHFYRRAHAIASSTLKPDDELVITSERNLRDFCKARGRTFESPKVPPAPALPDVPTAPSASARSEPVPSAVSQPRAVREARAATPAPTPTFEPAIRQAGVDAPPPVVHPINVDPAPTARRPAPALVLGLTGAALAAFVAGLFWLRTPSPERTTTVTPTPTPTAQVQGTPAPSAAAPATAAPTIVPPTAPKASTKPTPEPTPSPSRAATAVAEVGIVDALLCQSLSRSGAWRCTPVVDSAAPGRLFFYTRLKVARATTVNHRWYRGDKLVQTVDLRIQPNASAGYRTYSQNTVAAGSGNWRVELTASDGTVLREVRFAVQ